VVVRVDGVLDLTTVAQVRRSLQGAMDDGAHFIVLDLTGTRFIDSTGVGMIAWLHKQLQARTGAVSIAATEPVVLRVFELTSIDRLIPIHESVQAAEGDLSTGVKE
jgi:anti-sigma B factor antagonist